MKLPWLLRVCTMYTSQLLASVVTRSTQVLGEEKKLQTVEAYHTLTPSLSNFRKIVKNVFSLPQCKGLKYSNKSQEPK